MSRKRITDKSQLDLFVTASVHRFPISRRAALVRGVAATMAKKKTQKQRLHFLNSELNFQYAACLADGASFADAHEEIIRFRDKVIAEYHRLIYAPQRRITSEGDDAA